MSQLRLDPLTGRWTVISIERAERPHAFVSHRLPVEESPLRPCPFCPGSEDQTPPALETYGPEGEWQVRVVPNKYPAFRGSEAMVVTHLGPVFTQAPAGGIHEVLIFSPDHASSWVDLSDERADAGDGRHPRPDARALLDGRPALQPGHRQPRPGGRRIGRAPARAAPRHPLRAARDRRRARGLCSVPGLVPALHRPRGRALCRAPRRPRGRARRRHLPVLERDTVRAAGDPRAMPRICPTRNHPTWRRSGVPSAPR